MQFSFSEIIQSSDIGAQSEFSFSKNVRILLTQNDDFCQPLSGTFNLGLPTVSMTMSKSCQLSLLSSQQSSKIQYFVRGFSVSDAFLQHRNKLWPCTFSDATKDLRSCTVP